MSKMDDLFMSKLHFTCTFMVHNQNSSKMVSAKGQFSSALIESKGKMVQLEKYLEFWNGSSCNTSQMQIISGLNCHEFSRINIWLGYFWTLTLSAFWHGIVKMRNTRPIDMRPKPTHSKWQLEDVWAVTLLS